VRGTRYLVRAIKCVERVVVNYCITCSVMDDVKVIDRRRAEASCYLPEVAFNRSNTSCR